MDIELSVLGIITFTIHSYLCMSLLKRIVNKERFHGVVLFGVAIMNGLLSPYVIRLFELGGVLSHSVISIITILEVMFLFRDKISVKIGLAFGVLIHLFTCRSIVLGIHSLLIGENIRYIINHTDLLMMNTLVLLWVHIVVVVLFIKFVPSDATKDIIANRSLFTYIVALMEVLGVFYIYNAMIYEVDTITLDLSVQQIVLPLLLLGIFYLLLIFMIRLVMLDTYKKIIVELEHKIDKSQMLADELLVKSERDPLTNAYNKEAMRERIEDYLKENGVGILMVFDIDNFKGINDNFGHSFGDEILNEIYEKLKKVFRQQDLIGRFGGDEFVAFIMQEGIEKDEVFLENRIVDIATRICQIIEKNYKNEQGVEVEISTSIGIAIAPMHGTTYKTLFDAADSALYASKGKGKNTYTIYREELM